MPGSVFLRGDRVTLRTVEEEDLAFYRDTLADPDVRVPLSLTEPINLETAREFFEDVLPSETAVHLAVCLDREIRGLVWLFDLDGPAGHAEIGYWLTPEAHGQGLMTEAARLLVGYAFDELRCQRVRGRALASNDASLGVLENCGMIREVREREAKYVDGEYVDMVHLGVLAEEWAEQSD